MNKVLIDRELLEATLKHAEFVSGAACEADDAIRAVLVAPSGTPELPVKAYYHEAPNEYGGLNKSVGLEQRREFADAPLVLEADALARIACLEGEIAKRDAKYQRDVYGLNNEGDPIGGDPAGGYANDNARLRAELAAIKAQEPVAVCRDGYGTIDWYRVASGGTKLYAAPVSEAKAQDTVGEVVGWYRLDRPYEMTSYPSVCATWHKLGAPVAPLYAAPVSEAKAQGVVMPEHETSTPSSKWSSAGEPDPHGKAYDCERAELSMGEYTDDELANAVFMHDHRSFDIVATMRGEPGSIVLLTAAKDRIRWLSRSLDKALARLNAAPAAPAADSGLVEALDYQVLFDAIAAATSVYANGAVNISVQAFRDALAAHRAKGVV